MRRKEEKMLKMLELKVFELMVETEVDLYAEGLYDHPELPAEQIEVTEDMTVLLAASEAYERVMRMVLELSGEVNPWAVLEKSTQAHLVAQKIVNAPDQVNLPDKFDKPLQDFADSYVEARQQKKNFSWALN